MLVVDDISKWYGTTQVLKNLSLTVRQNERVVICGRSGSGKSTLLRCINGLETHQRGRIEIGGRELNQHARTLQAIRREVGMVFQAFNLFPHLTVLQNCTLAPRWAEKLSEQQARERALEQLRRVHVADHAEKYPRELSGGQQQRVAIARALCTRPRLLMFDEPTSALDPELVGSVLEVMRSLRESGMTMIVVSHEMGFARAAADRVVFMDHGLIVEQGAPAAIFENPSHERTRAFIGQIRRH